MGQDGQRAKSACKDGTAAGPERMCAVTRRVLEPDELIRFVCSPDGQIVADVGRRLPGRGVWVTCSRHTVAAALKGGAFARALRRPVAVPPDLPDLIDRLLVRRTMEALSLANKAGLVLPGFGRTETAVVSAQCLALLHASDAADDGAGKLDRKFRAVWKDRGKADEPAIVAPLTSAELSLAMGRSNVVHAALMSGGAGDLFLREAGRLQRYRAAAGPLTMSLKAGAKTEQA